MKLSQQYSEYKVEKMQNLEHKYKSSHIDFYFVQETLSRGFLMFNVKLIKFNTALFICVILSLFYTTQSFASKVEHFVAPSHEELRDLAEKAQAGDSTAQVELGNFYYISRFYEKAKLYYEAAAAQNNANALNKLGNMYHEGFGYKKDLYKAKNYYEQAANQGNIFAQYNLGNAYFHGEGCEKDIAKAIDLIKSSCEGGYEQACDTLEYIKIKANSKPKPENFSRQLLVKPEKTSIEKNDPVEKALQQARKGTQIKRNYKNMEEPLTYNICNKEYLLNLMRSISSNWSFPQTSNSKLSTTVKLYIENNGDLKNFDILKYSGSSQFDASVINAIREASNYDFPTLFNCQPFPCILEFSNKEGIIHHETSEEKQARIKYEKQLKKIELEKELVEEEKRRKAAEEKRMAEEMKRLQEEKQKAEAQARAKAREERNKWLVETGRIKPYGPKIFNIQLGMLADEALEISNKLLISHGMPKEYILINTLLLVGNDEGILNSIILPLFIFNYNKTTDKKLFVDKFNKSYNVNIQCDPEYNICVLNDSKIGYGLNIDFKEEVLKMQKITKESDLLFK